MKSNKDFVPEWAKHVVWYQIFPDRFRRGFTGNKYSVKWLKGAWPHDIKSPWKLHPWTSDWYELQTYEKKNGNDFWFNVHRRRYGGDLKGIFEKLDYLSELGISAIYLNPVFASPSNHKYDAVSYNHIDPCLGPDPAGDILIINKEVFNEPSTWKWTSADIMMLDLIKKVHELGFRIIFDGVFNHIGMNNPGLADLKEKQKSSKFRNWFNVISWDDPSSGTVFDYKRWAGFKELPEWKQNENGIAAGPKKYIFDITRRWMDPDNDGDPSDGIDGWRLDVAYCVKHQFWKDWRKHVKSINPDAYITAEVIDMPDNIKPYLRGDEFDAVMNYNFAFACTEFFINKKNKITVGEFDSRLRKLRNAFPGGVKYVQQNLFDSHDSNRILSHIVNKDLSSYRDWDNYFFISKAENPEYDTGKPNKKEMEILKLMVIFQMTYIGAPMIYYGDETGMWGANDPDCRKPMIWKDFEYDDEKYRPDQSKKSVRDKVKFNGELFNHYKKLIKIRNNHPELQTGSYRTLLTDDNKNIFAFVREKNKKAIIVVVNAGDKNKRLYLNTGTNRAYIDILNDKKYSEVNGSLHLTIPATWGRILEKQ